MSFLHPHTSRRRPVIVARQTPVTTASVRGSGPIRIDLGDAGVLELDEATCLALHTALTQAMCMRDLLRHAHRHGRTA